MLFSPEQREEIVEEARRYFDAVFNLSPLGRRLGCIYWAESMRSVLALRGHRTELAAGSAQFQFQPDDGGNITHYSYVFSMEEAVVHLQRGRLPELHAWTALQTPTGVEIIDLTSGVQPVNALDAGIEWSPDLLPPEYLWCDVEEIPSTLVYRPVQVAAQIAQSFLRMRKLVQIRVQF